MVPGRVHNLSLLAFLAVALLVTSPCVAAEPQPDDAQPRPIEPCGQEPAYGEIIELQRAPIAAIDSGPASMSSLRTCRCSCGFPCTTNADCGPGGVCGFGITCCAVPEPEVESLAPFTREPSAVTEQLEGEAVS